MAMSRTARSPRSRRFDNSGNSQSLFNQIRFDTTAPFALSSLVATRGLTVLGDKLCSVGSNKVFDHKSMRAVMILTPRGSSAANAAAHSLLGEDILLLHHNIILNRTHCQASELEELLNFNILLEHFVLKCWNGQRKF